MPSPRSLLPLAVTALVGFGLASPAAGRSRAHRVVLTAPSQLDFAIATITPRGSARGLRLSVIGSADGQYVAAAVARAHPYLPHRFPEVFMPPLDTHPGRVFVVIVNRVPRGSTEPAAKTITLRIETRSREGAPTLEEHVNVLAQGAPGLDCSMLHFFPNAYEPNGGRRLLFNSFVVLRSLLGWPGEAVAGDGDAQVQEALNQSCSGFGDFRRWVLQEPPPPHP